LGPRGFGLFRVRFGTLGVFLFFLGRRRGGASTGITTGTGVLGCCLSVSFFFFLGVLLLCCRGRLVHWFVTSGCDECSVLVLPGWRAARALFFFLWGVLGGFSGGFFGPVFCCWSRWLFILAWGGLWCLGGGWSFCLWGCCVAFVCVLFFLFLSWGWLSLGPGLRFVLLVAVVCLFCRFGVFSRLGLFFGVGAGVFSCFFVGGFGGRSASRLAAGGLLVFCAVCPSFFVFGPVGFWWGFFPWGWYVLPVGALFRFFR